MDNFKVTDREALMLHQLRRRLREQDLMREEGQPEFIILYGAIAILILLTTVGVLLML